MNVPLSIEIILYLLTQLTFLIALWSRNFYYLYYVDEETEALSMKKLPRDHPTRDRVQTQLHALGFKPKKQDSNPGETTAPCQEFVWWAAVRGASKVGEGYFRKWNLHVKRHRESSRMRLKIRDEFYLGHLLTAAVIFRWDVSLRRWVFLEKLPGVFPLACLLSVLADVL